MQLLQVYALQINQAAQESFPSPVSQWNWSGQHQKVMTDLVYWATLWFTVLQLHQELCIPQSILKAQLRTAR